METLKLRNPIKIDGKEVAEVTYDANEIDGLLFATAEAKRKDALGLKDSMTAAAEFDYSLHVYMGYAAIIAVNSSYSFEDVARIKGRDLVEVMKIGRNFILKSEKESPEKSSGEHTETMPESTTRAEQNSKENE